MEGGESKFLRVLCPKRTLLSPREPGLRWLIGSVFLPRFNVVSHFRCLHHLPDDASSPDFSREADDIRTLLLRGFNIVGALLISNENSEFSARKAAEATCAMRNHLSVGAEHHDMIGAVADLNSDDIHFFLFEMEKPKNVEVFRTILFESDPAKLLWENGCLIRCELALTVPIYAPGNRTSDMAELCSSLTYLTAAELKNPYAAFLIEGPNEPFVEASSSIVLHGLDLDFSGSFSENEPLAYSQKESNSEALTCSQFCSKNKFISSPAAQEMLSG